MIAKPGLDGHDVGAKIIALALRDAGAEVIYTGLRKSPEYIARIAVEEDVDAVGLSVLSGGHLDLVTDNAGHLADYGGDDIAIFVGGTIPAADNDALEKAGAKGIYNASQRIDDVLASIGRLLTA